MKSLSKLVAGLIASSILVGVVQAQAIPAQEQLPNVAWFNGASVDLAHARMVDLTPGAHKVIDALGVTHSGYFANTSAFTGSPTFKNYIRRSSGSYIFYNTSMMTKPDCANNSTVIPWITGGATVLENDSCSLKARILQYARPS
jgi:hypothetical protein